MTLRSALETLERELVDFSTCSVCGDNRPTCIGAYEAQSVDAAACDECCGHGNEDGHCLPVAEHVRHRIAAILAAHPIEVCKHHRWDTVGSSGLGGDLNWCDTCGALMDKGGVTLPAISGAPEARRDE